MTTGPDHEKLLREVVSDMTDAAGGGAPALDPKDLAARLGDEFDVLELVGRGGMGAVYKAVQRKLGRLVAIKVLPEDLASDAGFVSRFEQEARALASLSHPNILTVYDFGEREGLCFLVMEFVDGIDLQKLLELGQLSPAEALRITPQICQALHYAHQHGVVHRDVKPANILIDTDGQVKIADFGLARLVRADVDTLTRNTQVLGTPQYMAPEQYRSANVDHRADIFSLGVVIYEMLTGQLPVGHFDPPSRQPGVPHGLDEVVRRSLAQQPENRYQSARDVEQDVSRVQTGGGRSHRRAATQKNGSSVAKAIILVLVLGMAIPGFLVVSGAVYWLAMADQPETRADRASASTAEPQPEERQPEGVLAEAGSSTTQDRFLGQSTAAILRRFGPPVSITTSAGAMVWSYYTQRRDLVDSAFTFQGGKVILACSEASDLARARIPESGLYRGQPATAVVKELGQPKERYVGAGPITHWEYADGRNVYVAFGLVVDYDQK